MNVSEKNIPFEVWRQFWSMDDDSPIHSRYNQSNRASGGDYDAFIEDLQADHPEALAMYTRYITWKLTT